ncbi:hypothetical protein V2J09_022217 [Rumex salicifolius]
MEVERKRKVIVMVPYPAQGHVTPMLNLASSLPALGYRPIIILPEFLYRQIKGKKKARAQGGDSVLPEHQIIAFPDGMEEGPTGFFEIEKAMEDAMPAHLDRILRGIQEGGDEDVACLVADVLVSSAFHVARGSGIPAAGFWPAMAATYRLISSIPDLLQAGIIDGTGIPLHHGPISLKQDVPTINTQDLPWLIGSLHDRQSKFKFWVRTLNRARSLPWLLVNSFPSEVKTNQLNSQNGPIIYPIGFLKKREPISKRSPSLTFWAEDESCLDWLDKQKDNSVLYVSFGTWIGPTDKSKVKSLALSLEAMGRPFLWALGPKWADGLPLGFKERICDRGKVLAWVPQVQVLHHKAVGCFLTHCGWNSITEAILSKKCLICFPLGGDQLLNCVYIVDLWKIGVRIEDFGVREITDNVNWVMSDANMKRQVMKLSENFMGEEARLKMTANVKYFLNSLNNLPH